MAFWYLAHDDELLIDLDEYARPAKSGGPWGEVFFRRRLRDAILGSKLPVIDAYLAESSSPHHFHAIVRLRYALPTFERLTWQLELGSDLYRGRADLMRAARGIDAPSLLIRNSLFPDLYRPPDLECPCTEKHITSEYPECFAWRKYRGLSPWELFGAPSHSGAEYAVKLPRGRVPLELITEVRTKRARRVSGAAKQQARARASRRASYLKRSGRKEGL